MIFIPAKITGIIVTVSMGLFLAAVAVLFIVPLIQALVEKRRPAMPALPPVMENLGIAIALAGLTFRQTEFAAIGVGLALLGAWFGRSKKGRHFHPVFEKIALVVGVIGVGTLAEFYYVIG